MEIDVLNPAFDLTQVSPQEIEEALEDPYALRLLPDVDHGAKQTRYYLVAKTLRDRALFISFSTNGKVARIIFARNSTKMEVGVYDRCQAEAF